MGLKDILVQIADDTIALLQLEKQLREEALATAANLETEFWRRLRREGVSAEWRLIERQCDIRTGTGACWSRSRVIRPRRSRASASVRIRRPR